MLKDLAEYLRPREERLAFAGRALVVRELESAADVAFMADNEDLSYKLLVRCVFDEAGAPVFTEADVVALKAGAKAKLLPLMEAVNRVNGFDTAGDAKNSGAVPA